MDRSLEMRARRTIIDQCVELTGHGVRRVRDRADVVLALRFCINIQSTPLLMPTDSKCPNAAQSRRMELQRTQQKRNAETMRPPTAKIPVLLAPLPLWMHRNQRRQSA